MRNESALEDGDYYNGVTTACLHIKNATPKHSGKYWCKVTNKGGSVYSQRSQLTVSELAVVSYKFCVHVFDNMLRLLLLRTAIFSYKKFMSYYLSIIQ